MKKIIISICLLSMSMPAFARPNYEYTLASNTIPTNLKNNSMINYDANFASQEPPESYSKKIEVKEEQQPIITSHRNTKKNNNDKNMSGIKITQVGSTLYYDSGKRSTITGSAAQIGALAGATVLCMLDPYIVTLDGKEYMMIQDDNGIFEESDILGIDDNPQNIFRALKNLESDGDAKYITGEELQKANIRLVRKKNNRVYFSDKSQDFDITLVKHIPIKSMRRTLYKQTFVYTNNKINLYPHYGTFGTFDIYTYLNQNKKYTVQNYGKVDFVKDAEIKKWISGNN